MSSLNEELRPLIRVDEQIIEAEPGIYTWIIKGDRVRHLYAARVFSEQEIGTLHQDIVRQIHDDRPVQAAGELRVRHDGTIQFNIQSGTYTRNINQFHLKKDIDLVMKPELYNDIQDDVHAIYELMGEHNVHKPASLDDIKIIFGMRRKDGKSIRERMKRRIDLYKRNRMVSDIKEMLCSFFGKNSSCHEIIYLTGGNDELYLEHGEIGKNAEVLAGTSFLSETSLRNNPIITTNINRNRLNRIFKINTRKRNNHS